MARHFNFGNHGNEAVGCIAHDFPYLVLGVETPFFDAVVAARKVIVAMSHLRLFPVGSFFGQSGVFLDFDAPALVISEVEMKSVQLVESHQVEHFQHGFLGQEVAPHVHHGSAVSETGSIGEVHGRQLIAFCRFLFCVPSRRWQQLQERLHSVEQSFGRRVRTDADGFRGDG